MHPQDIKNFIISSQEYHYLHEVKLVIITQYDYHAIMEIIPQDKFLTQATSLNTISL